jgi:hypothetical protein
MRTIPWSAQVQWSSIYTSKLGPRPWTDPDTPYRLPRSRLAEASASKWPIRHLRSDSKALEAWEGNWYYFLEQQENLTYEERKKKEKLVFTWSQGVSKLLQSSEQKRKEEKNLRNVSIINFDLSQRATHHLRPHQGAKNLMGEDWYMYVCNFSD